MDDKPRRRTSTSMKPITTVDPLNHESSSITSPPKVAFMNTSTHRWLTRASALAMAASLILFALYATESRWRKTSPNMSQLLSTPTKGPAEDDILGILLHPEDHVSREPKIIELNWAVTSAIRAPDGVKKRVYLINGHSPGPTIEARPGDTLRIHVSNHLFSPSSPDSSSSALEHEPLSIHWHGLHMHDSNEMDGALGFTQCGIPSGETFTYEFRIGEHQVGTFWWHAHSAGMRGDGLFGGLVVHRPEEGRMGEKGGDGEWRGGGRDGKGEKQKYGYEKEVLLLIGDWYHGSAGDILAWYTSVRAFGNEPVPDSLVVNGKGSFNCSMAVPARPIECDQILFEDMHSVFGKELVPKRLRLVNTGSIAGITVGVTNAKLTPLQVDGGCETVGSTSDQVGILYPGERVDILVEWNANARALGSQLEIFLDPENFNYPNPSLKPNQSFPIFPSGPKTNTAIAKPSQEPVFFDLQTALSAQNSTLPNQADQTILLYTKTLKLAKYSNHPMGFMNRTSWSPQSPPLLSLPRSKWDANQLVPFIPISTTHNDSSSNSDSIPDSNHGPWVDLIINNLDDGSHPFHLHGHTMYLLARHRSTHGWGSHSPYSSAASNVIPAVNLSNPLRKDTVMVPRRGFVVVRFRAANQGLWMLHCHVLVHLGSGMAMGLHVGEDGAEGHEGAVERAGRLCGR